MGKSSARQEVAEYRMSIQYGICQNEVDAIYLVEGDEKTIWSGRAESNQALIIDNVDLFGGIKKEGGVQGVIFVRLGGASQILTDFEAGKFGRTPATMSAFRGVCTLFFTEAENNVGVSGFYWRANQPFLPEIAVGVEYYPTSLQADYAKVPRFGTSSYPTETRDLIADGSLDGSGRRGASVSISDAINNGYGLIVHADPSESINLKLDLDGTYTAWGPWGPLTPANEGSSGAVTNLTVIPDDSEADAFVVNGNGVFAGAAAAAAAWVDQVLTGYSKYQLVIIDTPLGDNTGGLSIIVDGDEQIFDANPAHMIYEALTNKVWGAGLPSTNIDVANFQAVSLTLFQERLGLTVKWILETSIEQFINEILDHIEGLLFVDPTTGLLTLKLIRDDYTIGSLRTVDENSARLIAFERPVTGELVNEISVTWTDPETESDGTTPPIYDEALIAEQGSVVSDSRNYYAVRSRQLAIKLGYRELLAAASPLAVVELELDRKHWDITDGEVINFSWSEYGVSQLLLRVTDLDRGSPDDAPIRVTLVEDVFGQDKAVFETPGSTKHVVTDEEPENVDFWNIITLPYYFVANLIDGSIASATAYPEVFSGLLAADDGADTFSYELLREQTNSLGNPEFQSVQDNSIVSYGTLAVALAQEATSTIAVAPSLTSGSGLKNGSFLIIGTDDDVQEIAVVSVANPGGSGDDYTILRGMLDTTPKAWPIGTPFFIVNDTDIFADPTVGSAVATVKYKARTITSLGKLAEASATELSDTLNARPWLPLRPANVQVNGVGFGTVEATPASSPSTVTVTWATRNRLTEDSVLQAWTNGDVTEETDQTVTVQILREDDRTVLATNDDVTSPYLVDSGDYSGEDSIIVRVSAKRTLAGSGSPPTVLESLQAHEITVIVGNVLQVQSGDTVRLQSGEAIELNS